jgi:hypothetical protein
VIDDYTEDKLHAHGNDIRWIRLRGNVDASLQKPVLKLHFYTACNDPRPSIVDLPVPADTVLHEVALTPGEMFDIGVKVSGRAGIYNAMLKGSGLHYFAISKAIISK